MRAVGTRLTGPALLCTDDRLTDDTSIRGMCGTSVAADDCADTGPAFTKCTVSPYNTSSTSPNSTSMLTAVRERTEPGRPVSTIRLLCDEAIDLRLLPCERWVRRDGTVDTVEGTRDMLTLASPLCPCDTTSALDSDDADARAAAC